jgi:oligopeptide transport system substrate-binding protein
MLIRYLPLVSFGTRRRALVTWTAVLVTVAAGVAGCDEQADPAGTVRIAIREPNQLIPSGVDEADGAQVLSALFTPLVELDETGRPAPLAAESVEPSEDGRVWTIRLRDGFTFHNGEPVLADNYIDAWNYAAYQPNEQRNSYHFRRIAGYQEISSTPPAAETLSGLTKVDDLTFTVTLSEPFGGFVHALGAPAFYPLPAAAFEADGALSKSFQEAPIGNGPFRLAGAWRHGELIAVERYESYANPCDPEQDGCPVDRPELDEIEFVIYPESADPYPDLLAGELDVVTEIPAGHLATAESDLGERFVQRPAATFQYLAFPAYEAALANPEVRRSISMAIDREEIAIGIFRDTQLPARSFVPPVIPGARDDSCGAACRFDPNAARLLYARAGGPARLTITYNLDGGHGGWVEAVCDQLREHLGVECVPAAEPSLAGVLAKLDAEQPVGMVRLSWVMDYPSMESYLGPIFASGGSANVHGYQNPDLDALVAAGDAAGSPDAAVAAYRQAEDVVARDLPVVPLRFDEHATGHSPRVRGIAFTGFDQLDLTGLAFATD